MGTNIHFIRMLGTGSFGYVWLGIHNNVEVAIKQFFPTDINLLNNFNRELQILILCQPSFYIVQLVGSFYFNNIYPMILMEFCTDGNFNDYINKKIQKNEKLVRNF